MSEVSPSVVRNVAQQHKLAKELLAQIRANQSEAIARAKRIFPDRDVFQLADAQLILAREAGFDSWKKLIAPAQDHERAKWTAALRQRDVEMVRRLLANSEYLQSIVNDPIGDFGGRPLHMAGNDTALIDVLLAFGADPNLGSDWEKGPFTVLDQVDERVAHYLISRGAILTPNVAARLGWIDALHAMLDADAQLVHARGGDGKTPLHEAMNIDIADLLLHRGADINARCTDHHSTAAMYALMDRPAVCRHLIARGAQADLFQAAQLGDIELARRLIEADPTCVAARVDGEGYAAVPKFSIYLWSIGRHVSPAQLARKAGHMDVAALIESKQEPRQRLLDAAWEADEAGVNEILRVDPQVMSRLSEHERGLMAAAAFANRPATVRLMLKMGFDVNARGNDQGTCLHQACWIGSIEMVEMLLATGRCALNDRGDMHQCTPIGWAAYGSVHCSWGPKRYEEVIRALARAGANLKLPGNLHGGTIAGMAKGNPNIERLLIELGAG